MKLLISLPLSNEAQKYYGSKATVHNKAGDAGVDLPFIRDVRPYDAEVTQTLMRIDFETIFAMYDLNYIDDGRVDTLAKFMSISGYYPIEGGILQELSRFMEIRYYKPVSFIVCPRSSIDKTPFRQSNSIGIIDKTYKGLVTNFCNQSTPRKVGYPDILEADTLKASLDYHPQLGKIDNKPYLSAGDRILQIVAPALDDILHVRLDYTETNMRFWSEAIGNKNRGGFGSTGA